MFCLPHLSQLLLDECTSAVDMAMERMLYEQLLQCYGCGGLDGGASAACNAETTVLSVGHRDSLRAFHQFEVQLSGSSK